MSYAWHTPPPEHTFIYRLVCPRSGETKYVGKSDDPEKRLSAHLTEARAGRTADRHEWIRSLLEDGLEPELEIIERCKFEEYTDREAHWIRHYLREGCDLVNGVRHKIRFMGRVPYPDAHKIKEASKKYNITEDRVASIVLTRALEYMDVDALINDAIEQS